MKLITKEIGQKLIAGYRHSAETGESAKDVVVKYFTPWARATWYISEGWPVNDDGEAQIISMIDPGAYTYDWHLFGFCDLGDSQMAELGYVMLSDLQSLKGPFGLKVERDSSYSGSMAEVMAEYGRAAA